MQLQSISGGTVIGICRLSVDHISISSITIGILKFLKYSFHPTGWNEQNNRFFHKEGNGAFPFTEQNKQYIYSNWFIVIAMTSPATPLFLQP